MSTDEESGAEYEEIGSVVILRKFDQTQPCSVLLESNAPVCCNKSNWSTTSQCSTIFPFSIL